MKEIVTNNLSQNIQLNNLNINHYIININKFPLLNISDEYKITKYFKKTLDIKAANILIITHLRFVVRISKYYIKFGLFLNDLIQEGSIGLIKSIKRYNPKRDTRLVTFSIHWIKSEINNYIIKNWKIIRTITTQQQRSLFFNVKKKDNINNIYIKNNSNKIYKDFNINILNIINKNNNINSNLEQKKNYHYKDCSHLFIENNLRKISNKKLKKCLMLLDKRSREIIYKRYLSKSFINYTLANLARIFKISQERVRQIEKLAIKKLRNLL